LLYSLVGLEEIGEKKMTIEKRKSDGAFIVSDIIDNQLITKTYIGFTKKESKSLFKRDKIKGWL